MYNVKLIEYPNGECQLRRYSTPMDLKEKNFYETDEYLINPFTCDLVRVVEDFPDKQIVSSEDNLRRSYNRTKQKIHEYSRCIEWEKFITMTFNPEMVDRYNYYECSKTVRQWLHNQRRNAPDLQYLIIPEMHKDGAWHFHGLLANTGNIKFKDSGKKAKNKQTIYNMSAWKYGFTTATDILNIHSCSKYVGKYITKDLCNATKGAQRYFISSNFPEPTTSTFLVYDDADFHNLLERLIVSLGVDIAHVSSPRYNGSYNNVDYYELLAR